MGGSEDEVEIGNIKEETDESESEPLIIFFS